VKCVCQGIIAPFYTNFDLHRHANTQMITHSVIGYQQWDAAKDTTKN